MDETKAATPATSTWRIIPRRGHAVAVIVLLGALALVFSAWDIARDREVRVARTRFVAKTGEVTDLLRERLVQFELVTRGGASLFASVDGPTAEQWRSYADGMQISRRFPAMVGLGFAGYVRGGNIAQLQLDWRDAGYGLLNVRPHGAREAYGPILYLEPRTAENVAAIGFDMYSNPTRHAAMEMALETGEARLTGPVRLVQDGPSPEVGLLLYLPVYHGGQRPQTRQARRREMQGWVYLPMRMGQFVESALGSGHRDLGFRIHDVTGGHDATLLYASGTGTDRAPAFRHTRLVHQYGRDWRIDFESAALDVAAPRLDALNQSLALGLLAALLLYGLTLVLARTESRAQAIALRLTRDLRSSEARFRVAMVYASTGNALLDGEGRIVEANPALAAILQRDASGLPGLDFESLFMEAPGAEIGTQRADVLRSTRRVHRDDGTVRHVQLTYAPVPGVTGQDIARLVQVDDVTERMRAEARVHALNRTLEARVALRTRELSQANQELESFAYSVSHDLRAPLRAIDGFSRILGERYSDVLDEAGRSYLGRVRKAAARMGELIDAMLRMARLSRGEMKVGRVDLSRVAAELAEDLQAAEPERDVELVIEPGLEASGDAVLLRNLLDNLLGNAWKFTRGREPARIRFGRLPADRGGEFFISDNGAGFPQEYVDKLFRPFQRLHSHEDYNGHGIGLATVRRIVERHGGSIRATGREGEGATFYFTLQAEPSA